jgi:hypothetical protein
VNDGREIAILVANRKDPFSTLPAAIGGVADAAFAA